jgi:hypothetical protein
LLLVYEGKKEFIKRLTELEAAAKVLTAQGVDVELLDRKRGQSEPALPTFVFRGSVIWRSLTGRKPSANKHTRRNGPKDPDFVLFIQELATLGQLPPPSRKQVETSLKSLNDVRAPAESGSAAPSPPIKS